MDTNSNLIPFLSISATEDIAKGSCGCVLRRSGIALMSVDMFLCNSHGLGMLPTVRKPKFTDRAPCQEMDPAED